MATKIIPVPLEGLSRDDPDVFGRLDVLEAWLVQLEAELIEALAVMRAARGGDDA